MYYFLDTSQRFKIAAVQNLAPEIIFGMASLSVCVSLQPFFVSPLGSTPLESDFWKFSCKLLYRGSGYLLYRFKMASVRKFQNFCSVAKIPWIRFDNFYYVCMSVCLDIHRFWVTSAILFQTDIAKKLRTFVSWIIEK